MKINRLFNIVHILLNKGKITAKELAEEFEVSTRTIYRDIETLTISGIPIYTDKGNGGGLRLLDNYVLNKTVISQEDKNSILLGLEVIQATDYDNVNTAIKKLKTLFDKDIDNYIEVDFSSFDNVEQKKIFSDIKISLKRNQTLKINYSNNMGELTSRDINPLKLVFKKQRWYIIAYCNKRNDYRTFRISRIKNTTLTDKLFNRNDYNIENYIISSYEMKNTQTITLTLNAKALYRVTEEFNLSMINKDNHQNIIVTFESEIDDWISNYILSYADHLIDIKPIQLKNKVKEKALKISKL